MGGPYLVHRYFAGFLIYADLGNLCGIRIRRRRPHAAAFVFATTRRGRRRVRASAGQRPVEVNRRDDSLLKAHMLLRTILFARLQDRPTKNLAIHMSTRRFLLSEAV